MARAHDGHKDAAGVATNLGLLALGRVMRARAAAAAGDEQRVPYRDATLTRLLQPGLEGGAAAAMLACVAPGARDADATLATLKFARLACTVALRPTRAAATERADDDPMAGDADDADALLQRRCVWIGAPGFGDVFARVVGDASAPLVLWVHGSGPHNSSVFWADAMADLARAGAACRPGPRRFLQVAIDCPGYGRSPGDRQTIRSYPGALLAAIARALGRKSALAVVGSSQGSAAALNAALELPKLCGGGLALVHPVSHAPLALMMYDVRDDGHPVAVGRQLRRVVPRPRYFEFDSAIEPDWDARHLPQELLAMLYDDGTDAARAKALRRAGRLVESLPDLTRVAGGVRAYQRERDNEIGRFGGERARAGGARLSETDDDDDARGADDDCWRAVLNKGSNLMKYVHTRTGRVVNFRPPGAKVVVERLEAAGSKPARGGTGAGAARAVAPLFDPEEEEDDEPLDSEDEEERAAADGAAAAAEAEREAAQTTCDACARPLVEPLRLARCRCALCACCAEEKLRYTQNCPACGERTELSSPGRRGLAKFESDADELRRRAAARVAALALIKAARA